MSRRVLRVIADLQVGGVQRMMLRGLKLLRAAGVESEVCCQQRRGPLAEAFEAEGFAVHLVPFKSRLDPRGLLALRRLADRGHFDIIHAHQYASNVAVNVAFLGRRDLRVVNSYHSITPVRGRGQARRLRWTAARADAIVAVSQAVRHGLADSGLDPERVTIIHNGASVPPERAPLPPRAPGDPLRLVYAGRFVRQKRLELLLEMLAHCRQRGLPFTARLYGAGPTQERLAARVGELGLADCVSLPGVTDDVPAALREAELYVTISEREGFSNALLEAGAQGRGFVGSDIAPHREMRGESEAGLLLPDAPEAWADALEALLGEPERLERMGRAAYARAREFSDENCAEKMLELYQRLGG